MFGDPCLEWLRRVCAVVNPKCSANRAHPPCTEAWLVCRCPSKVLQLWVVVLSVSAPWRDQINCSIRTSEEHCHYCGLRWQVRLSNCSEDAGLKTMNVRGSALCEKVEGIVLSKAENKYKEVNTQGFPMTQILSLIGISINNLQNCPYFMLRFICECWAIEVTCSVFMSRQLLQMWFWLSQWWRDGAARVHQVHETRWRDSCINSRT